MAAASTAVRDLLTGPARPATVLAAFESAVYLQLGGRVLGLLARDAARLPLGLVVAADAAERPFAGLARGDVLLVGDSAVTGPLGRRWRVQRWWDPRIPAPADHGPADGRGNDGRGNDGRGNDDGPAADIDIDADALDAAVRALVGAGPGLTPAGDDVLCGVLAALTVLGDHVRRDLLAAAVHRHTGRTGTLSAALLGCAADGQGLPELTRLLTAVVRGAPVAEQRRALTALLAIGHTSGAALAAGALLTLRFARRPVTTARGPVTSARRPVTTDPPVPEEAA